MSSTQVTRRALIYGGKGALGSACVALFKQHNWWVGSIDLVSNDEASANVLITKSDSLLAQEVEVVESVGKLLPNDSKVDVIVCVAGGWAGGSAASKDFIKNSDLMIKQSVWSSLIASRLASKYLSPTGLLTLTGAKAALEATPGMIGYGLAKASVHHLVKSLADPKGGLPASSSVVAILPITLDTPMNRKFMPDADFGTWTPLEFIAHLFYGWASGDNKPASGSLCQLITDKGETVVKIDN